MKLPAAWPVPANALSGFSGARPLARLDSTVISTRLPHPTRPTRRLGRLIRIDIPAYETTPGQQTGVSSRRIARLILVFLVAAALVWSWNYRTPKLSRRPGQIVPDFSLVDTRTGQVNRLSDYRGSVLVVVFVGTSCPVGDLYMPRLRELCGCYESRGVNFLAINSNESATVEDVADYARRSEALFPFLKDFDNQVADQLLIERTCEALLIDRQGRLRYRGAIDDQYGLGKRRDRPVRHYLTDAIDAVLTGRAVSPELTPVVGCPIERQSPRRPQPSSPRAGSFMNLAISGREQTSRLRDLKNGGSLTYAADVAPVIHARCATCHRPGQVGPFSLLTFADARRWSASITEVVGDGRMPPWHADPGHGHFSNDRSVSDRDRSTLLAWVEQGCAPGDLSKAPEPPERPQGWTIGTPDLVFELPETFRVPADGRVPIIHFRVPTNLREDIWVQAAEARPSDRTVVHHIFVYTEKYVGGITRQKEKIFLASYLPGDVLSVYPPGVAKKLPAGSDLVFEVHYAPIGKVRFDRSSVGFITTKSPPRHLAITRGIAAHGLRIPPGASDHVERANWSINKDIHVLSFSPHMHLRGKSFRYQASYPDGNVEVLLSVPSYDFAWQSVYRLAEPKAIPRGTTIHCEAHFDNSPGNIANPDPGRTVVWGEQTEDEMMMGYLDYYEDPPAKPE